MTLLAKSILKTLAFFDAQGKPLTLMEIKNYLINLSFDLSPPPAPRLRRAGNPSPSFRRVAGGQERSLALMELKIVLETELADKISFAKGFYVLRGREHLVDLGHRNYRISLRRMRKARKILYFLRFIPYVRAVALSGSQALLNSDENSDIDLLVVTAKHRIWLTRMFVSLYFHLLGQRRYHIYTKNRFCLNHYLCQDLLITRDKNLYTAVEYSSCLPVLGEKTFAKFWQKNLWLKEFLASPLPETRNTFFAAGPSFFQKGAEACLELVFLAPLLNRIGSWYQKQRIKSQNFVFISDSELSFHPESKGQQILAKFDLTLLRQGFGGQESEEILSGYEKNPPKLQRRSDLT